MYIWHPYVIFTVNISYRGNEFVAYLNYKFIPQKVGRMVYIFISVIEVLIWTFFIFPNLKKNS